MYLSEEEQAMLEGNFGAGTAFAMELLAKVGDAVGAERMIKAASSHIVSFGYQYYGFLAECRELDEKMLEGVEAFRIPATTNPKFFDVDDEKLIRRFGIADSVIENVRQSMTDKVFEKLGALPTYTCTPFFTYQTRKGESLAGAESIAIVMYNSVYGARLNRETGPTSLASAITGRTPEFGMHKPENRYAQVQVDLDSRLQPGKFTSVDYGALGYYVGKVAGDRSSVFTGIPQDISIKNLKYLLAPLGVSGAAMLSHIVGITPEAPTLEAALLGRKPEEKIAVDGDTLDEVYAVLNTASEEKADIAVFGCPHAPIDEIIEITRLLEGKKIRDDAFLLIATAAPIRLLASRMGLTDIVEKSGGLIISDTCPHIFLYPDYQKALGIKQSIKVMATDSAKCAHYAGAQGLKIKYMSAAECINSVM